MLISVPVGDDRPFEARDDRPFEVEDGRLFDVEDGRVLSTPPRIRAFYRIGPRLSDMNVRARSRQAGIVASVASVLLLLAPYAVVSGFGREIADYYAAGPVGAWGIALFALLTAVVFASVERGNVDPGTLAGALVVLTAVTPLLAVLWYLSINPTRMFAEYRWLEWHAPAVIAATLPLPALAGVYARELLT